MATAVGVIGILIAIMGVAFALGPGLGRAFVKFFQSPTRIYIGLGMRFLFGIFFIYASRYCRPENYSQKVVLGIGVLAVTLAILFGLLGPSRMLAVVSWLVERSTIIRSAGITATILGGYLIYASGAF